MDLQLFSLSLSLSLSLVHSLALLLLLLLPLLHPHTQTSDPESLSHPLPSAAPPAATAASHLISRNSKAASQSVSRQPESPLQQQQPCSLSLSPSRLLARISVAQGHFLREHMLLYLSNISRPQVYACCTHIVPI